MDANIDTYMDDDTEAKENEANEEEKEWWSGKDSLSPPNVEEERLPLIFARDVTFKKFAKHVDKCNARSGEHEAANCVFGQKFVSAVNSTHEYIHNWGRKSYYEEADSCYVPEGLIPTGNNGIVVANPCDQNGNPWPTIIVEVASSESLSHAIDKVNNYWFLPNYCEDVIIIKIDKWRNRRHNSQTLRPLRRLRCLKFCRTASLQQNLNTTKFEAIEEIEFGSVHPNGQESSFCIGPHMKWITIDCNCIFSGCQQPFPLFNVVQSSVPLPPQSPSPLQRPGVAIDLYDIQQSIFRAMGVLLNTNK
ncbi:hypothetical protein RhiirA4_421451 [Rhizophagus irregularis]|uniref:Uncharacterized protein n=1 Tax=Rhizophagus irregularis TaxID=588596 RepID=A0A2I1GLJ2_9GLOM|nr:hypothetical protein RhiirA4_421451 [Rhizophagus irregularis]